MSSPADPQTSSDKPARSHRYLVLIGSIALVAFLIDLGTKIWAVHALSDREPLELAGGALYLTLARNSGAAFSLGTDFTVIITCVMLAVVIGILVIARRVGSTGWAWALGLILGGALGNLADRLFRDPSPFRGAVVDFFSVLDPYGGFFPIFNVADSCIVCGGILAAFLALTGRELNGSRVGDEPAAQADAAAITEGSSAEGSSAGESRAGESNAEGSSTEQSRAERGEA